MRLGGPLLNADAAPLCRLYEDDRLLIIDKPAGLLVHRSALDAHESDTVHARLLRETGVRFHPVHRLDKGTSGALVLALSLELSSPRLAVPLGLAVPAARPSLRAS